MGDLSNTEDNYGPAGMMGDRPLHPGEMNIPPSGFPHHPLLNLQSLHSLFPAGAPPGSGAAANLQVSKQNTTNKQKKIKNTQQQH